LFNLLKNFWAKVRQLSGDDAYDRYLQHYAEYHQDGLGGQTEPPLSKEEFFKDWQDKKWTGVKRCC
jgi:uncharacterized short protein YbdD (DUF466 family)